MAYNKSLSSPSFRLVLSHTDGGSTVSTPIRDTETLRCFEITSVSSLEYGVSNSPLISILVGS